MEIDIVPSRIYKERINDIIIRGKTIWILTFIIEFILWMNVPFHIIISGNILNPNLFYKKKNKSKNVSCVIL